MFIDGRGNPGNTELVLCGQQKRCVKRDFGLRRRDHVQLLCA